MESYRNSAEAETRGKELKKPIVARLMPFAIGVILISMSMVLFIKGRSSKGTCSYDHVYRKVICKVKHLDAIPDDIPTGALVLVFGNKLDKAENSFGILEPSNFSQLRQVQDLQLVRCGIHEIRSDTFAQLSSLRRLDLRYNRIESVSELTFRGLKNLEYLYLSNNPITHLADFTFRGIRIENLILANNPALSQISSKAFAGAIIKNLALNRCSLSNLATETLWHVGDSLEELHLTNNIQSLTLPDAAFKGLTLRVLNLDGNGLTDADFLEDVIAEEISLDDNPLGEVDFDDSDKFLKIKRLSLGNIKLTELSREDFSMLSNLEELDLEQNQLISLNASIFAKLTNLKILDVSGNDIKTIEGDFDVHLPALRSLFLDDNDLETLPAGLEPFFSRLEMLTLHNNPLHCNCELQWLADWLTNHSSILHDRHALRCVTPEPVNFTEDPDNQFQCRKPVILNATLDPDGISLVCTAEGDPPPNVSWLGSDESLAASTRPSTYDRRNLQTKCTIAITKENNYTCTANNIVGNDSAIIDTTKIPTSGLKFVYQSREIEILETPQGFFVTALLLVVLGYIFRNSR
ncbi:hypothetical protein LSH36_823g02002 [Paralvinella palmiformis]|uniref:Ig-like domain-containing protein n=1 Tax=Paralvinella palmiformis TaxID=53620 RepID=A0AAD9IZ99_9ANNE|nr:hypothetical protein LSH36_823g02002 [Paralvinella palmiformis]